LNVLPKRFNVSSGWLNPSPLGEVKCKLRGTDWERLEIAFDVANQNVGPTS
jgi:hypothetical protein